MIARLIAIVEDCQNKKRSSVYAQEDGQYFVLRTPLSPVYANSQNVEEFHDLSFNVMAEIAMPRWDSK